MVDYIFYETKYPYKFVEKVSVAREHFCGIIGVNENRAKRNERFVVAAMYWYNFAVKPVRIVKITQGAQNKWNTKPLLKMIHVPDGDRLRDCILTEKD